MKTDKRTNNTEEKNKVETKKNNQSNIKNKSAKGGKIIGKIKKERNYKIKEGMLRWILNL